MAVIGTEDIAFWEKVYNVFPPKNLDSLFVVENFSKSSTDHQLLDPLLEACSFFSVCAPNLHSCPFVLVHRVMEAAFPSSTCH